MKPTFRPSKPIGFMILRAVYLMLAATVGTQVGMAQGAHRPLSNNAHKPTVVVRGDGVSIPPLDNFNSEYGFPTFPKSTEHEVRYRVPFIYYGPSNRLYRISDVTKVPIVVRH